MANIKNFINHEGATFNDNSVTITATQNNSSVELQPQTSPVADMQAHTNQQAPISPTNLPEVVFDGNKTDLARVINAAVLKRCFKHPNGTLATQEEMFALFDAIFKVGFNDYGQLLNQTKGVSENANSKVFDSLKELCLKYAKGEISNN